MGYELKHIIAICLIVKLVALSTEFSIAPEMERLNQGSDTVKSPQLTSLAGVKEPWATQMDEKSQGVHFNFGPGGKKSSDIRKFNKKYVTKSEKLRINSAFGPCNHMVGLLETSKWRDIQKTLRWLNRALASSSNNPKTCRRKSGKSKPKFGVISKKLSFYSPKINPKSKSNFEVKKFSDTLVMNCRQNFINSLTPPSDSEQSEKLKNECEHKYKFGKNKLKRLYQKKSRGKTKNRKYSRKKIFGSHGNYFIERPANPNTTVESKNVFSHPEKLYFTEKKNEMKNFSGEKVRDRKSGFENAVKIYRKLEENLKHLEQVANQRLGDKGKISRENWPVSLELRKPDGKNYKKENPWPNFVYHRVSSDLFHVGSTATNHKQSAYVAISVNTSGVPETTRNKNKIFGL